MRYGICFTYNCVYLCNLMAQISLQDTSRAMHTYNTLILSVGWSVGWSVGRSISIKWIKNGSICVYLIGIKTPTGWMFTLFHPSIKYVQSSRRAFTGICIVKYSIVVKASTIPNLLVYCQKLECG